MARIKSIADCVSNWTTYTPQRTEAYRKGVTASGVDWQTPTANAEGSWGVGVQAAMQARRFSGGVTKATNSKWVAKTGTKGVTNWGPGVSAAGPDYQAGYTPYQAAYSAYSFKQPRAAKGSASNLARVAEVCTLFRAVKLAAR